MRTAFVIIAAALVGTISTESFASPPFTSDCQVQTMMPGVGLEDRGASFGSLGLESILFRRGFDPMAGDSPYDAMTGAAPRMGGISTSKSGAMVGFGVGFAVGLATGVSAGDDFIMSANSKGLFLGLVTGFIGAGIGSMIGGHAGNDRWEGGPGSRMPKLGLDARGGDLRLALAY
jgi:hypothetical protein